MQGRPQIPVKPKADSEATKPGGIFAMGDVLNSHKLPGKKTPAKPTHKIPDRQPSKPLPKVDVEIGAPAAPARSHLPPPPPADIGAPFGPAPKFTLKSDAELEVERQLRQAAKRDNANNEEIFKARNDITTRKMLAARTSATAGLTPTDAPFAGIGGPGEAKHPEWIADASAKSQLALDRATRLAPGHGGLLPDAGPHTHGKDGGSPQQREKDALRTIETSHSFTFADRHKLGMIQTPMGEIDPTQITPHKTLAEIAELVNSQQAVKHIPDPRAPQDTGPGWFASQELPGTYGSGHATPTSLASDAWDAIARGQIGTEADRKGQLPNEGQLIGGSDPRIVNKAAQQWGQLAKDIQPHPDQAVLKGIKVAKDQLTVEAAQGATTDGLVDKNDQVDISDAVKYGVFALGPELRKVYVDMAASNGWPAQDANTWNDAELAARAFQKFHRSAIGFLENLAADSTQLGSLGVAPLMVGATLKDSIAQRSLTPTARLLGEYVQQYGDHLPGISKKYSTGSLLYTTPFTVASEVIPGGKFLGNKLGATLGLAVTREIRLPSVTEAIRRGEAPEGSDILKVPASQHPVTRLGQLAHDAILARGKNPDAVAQQAPLSGTAANVPRDVAREPGRVIARAGHYLEKRATTNEIKNKHKAAALEAGQESAVRLRRFLNAVKDLKGGKGSLVGHGKQQATAESIVRHYGAATDSTQMAEYFDGRAKEWDAAATRLDAIAAEHSARADRLKAVGNERGAAEASSEAKQSTIQAEERRFAAEDARSHAEFSRAHGMDPLHHTDLQHVTVAEAARSVVDLQTEWLKESQAIDDKGELYGHLAQRLEIVHKTEGPGTERGGAEGTPAWQQADKVLKLREAHNEVRARLTGEKDALASADASFRSDEAQHHMGRNRAASAIWQQVERLRGRGAARNARVGALVDARSASEPVHVSNHPDAASALEAAMAHEGQNPGVTARVSEVPAEPGTGTVGPSSRVSTHATQEEAAAAAAAHRAAHPDQLVSTEVQFNPERGTFDHHVVTQDHTPGAPTYDVHAHAPSRPDAVAAAKLHAHAFGIVPEAIDRIVRDAHTAITSKRAALQQRLDHMRGKIAEQLKAERDAHEHASGAELRKARNELTRMEARQATDRIGEPKKLKDLRARVAELETKAQEGFKPSPELALMLRTFEKDRLSIHTAELTPIEINAIIDRHFGADSADMVGRQTLTDAIEHVTHDDARLESVRSSAKKMHLESKAAFEKLTGKDTIDARKYDVLSKDYLKSLQDFMEMQNAEGRYPFHTRMKHPGEKNGLKPIMVSEGDQFSEGNFTPDMHYFIIRDLEGLTKKKVEAALFGKLAETPFVIHDVNPGQEIPPGFVRVAEDQWKTLLKVNRTAEATASMLDDWKTVADRQAGRSLVPHDGKGSVLISKDLHDWITEQLDPSGPYNGDPSVALQMANMYRRWMLYSVPRTLINNAIGNPILALVEGTALRSYINSVRLLRHDPGAIPHTLRGRGPLASALYNEDARLTGYQATLRDANVYHEDLARIAVYLRHAVKEFKHENNIPWFKRIDVASEEMRSYLHDLSSGKNADVHRFLKFSEDFFGEMSSSFKHDATLATLFLFHKWVAHMIKLTLWTMPLKYPGRMMFLQQTAILADQYRKEHGVFPEWAQGMIPLWQESVQVLGLPQTITWALSGGGVNPFSTPQQTIDFGSVGQPRSPLQSAFGGNLNPIFRVPLEFATGYRMDTLQKMKGWHGEDLGYLNPKVLLNGVIANTPGLNSYALRAGLSDDSIQVFDEHPRYTRAGLLNNDLQAPRPLGHGFIQDNLIRLGGLFGVSIRPLDAGGERARQTASRTVDWEAQQAALRAGRENLFNAAADQKLHDTDLAAWKRKWGVKP